MSIYQRVLIAFQAAAKQRGEHLPAGILNFIAWKFMVVKETLGAGLLESHLEYEVEKYLREGLRPDYKQDLHLF